MAGKTAKTEIGRCIREIRQARGLNARELASAAEMSAGYLSEVERGMSAVSSELLVRIARALQTSVGVFLGESNEMEERTPVQIPRSLSDAAEENGWSYRTTLLLLEGKMSLTARRSSEEEQEWEVHDWIKFCNKVKDFLPK